MDEDARKKYLGAGREPRQPPGIRRPARSAPGRFHATTASRPSAAAWPQERKLKAAEIIHPARLAVSGKTKGAGLFEIMELLGKDKVIQRMKDAAS